jgi:4-hydroxy-tetrahydrodipicolinate reductase
MKIALLGYGKMGKIIEKIALNRGHEIVLRKTSLNAYEGITDADVAIDFSIPDVAVANISEALNHQIPVVSGTTGWLENYHQMVALCEANDTAFLYGSNFSLGVNIFFEINDFKFF